jgi:hypothetical protein
VRSEQVGKIRTQLAPTAVELRAGKDADEDSTRTGYVLVLEFSSSRLLIKA